MWSPSSHSLGRLFCKESGFLTRIIFVFVSDLYTCILRHFEPVVYREASLDFIDGSNRRSFSRPSGVVLLFIQIF